MQKGGNMSAITVRRTRLIDAPPEDVFAALSDPQELSALLPRVRKIELLDRGPDRARVVTHMALGPFGDIRNEGEVRWQSGREVVFRSARPMPVCSRWQLRPAAGGTEVEVSLELDLAPVLGFMASFVPEHQVAAVVAPDLDTALLALEQRACSGLLERARGE